MLKLDALDFNILRMLISDARTPFTDIAKELEVSSGTIHVRMRKMEKLGIVVGSHLEVNYKILGYDISSFVGILLDDGNRFKEVINELKNIPEVTSAHYTTGKYNIFSHLICRDTSHLREVLADKIQTIKGVQHIESFLSLEEPIKRPGVPEALAE